MSQNNTSKVRISDGMIRQNMVLMSGLFTGPVIAAASTFRNSLIICLVFTLVTFISIGLCRLLPKKLAFAVRVVLYALIASAVYVPVILLAELTFDPDAVSEISLYLAIVVTNPLIMSKCESRFFLRPVLLMLKDITAFVLGFDLSCILVGAIRDILTDNMLWNVIIPLPFQVPAMANVYGGFILVGLLAAMARFFYRKYGRRKKRNGNLQ